MCLSLITSRRTGRNPVVTKLWKVFRVNKTHTCDKCHNTCPSSDPKDWKLTSEFQQDKYTDDKLGVWLTAAKGVINGGKHGNFTYDRGFHAYGKRIKDTEGVYNKRYSILIPVEFRYIHTVGKQSNKPVLVAYQMRIPKNWRKYVK
jgi:hypothetical protein